MNAIPKWAWTLVQALSIFMVAYLLCRLWPEASVPARRASPEISPRLDGKAEGQGADIADLITERRPAHLNLEGFPAFVRRVLGLGRSDGILPRRILACSPDSFGVTEHRCELRVCEAHRPMTIQVAALGSKSDRAVHTDKASARKGC